MAVNKVHGKFGYTHAKWTTGELKSFQTMAVSEPESARLEVQPVLMNLFLSKIKTLKSQGNFIVQDQPYQLSAWVSVLGRKDICI